ncbi:MAG: DJ-1/PfpI family protein, partial [Actinomycetota bacterium]
MESHQGSALQGKRVAVLMTDGVEQVEYTGPRRFLEEHGAQVTLVSPKPKGEQIQGFNHLSPGDRFPVEMNVREAHADEFDALVLPGGVANPDQLR